MNAVIEHGTPLVDDPNRIGVVRQLGIDETTYLSATRSHPTPLRHRAGDLEAKVLIDLVEGNGAADLRRWTANEHYRLRSCFTPAVSAGQAGPDRPGSRTRSPHSNA